jgi:hypothetical protein
MLGLTDKWLAKAGFHPRNGCSDGYPFDLDASLRYVRPRTGIDLYPTHSNVDNFAKLGAVSGFLPEMDNLILGMAFGAIPYGPIMSQWPENLQWQMMIPGLNKYQPQS